MKFLTPAFLFILVLVVVGALILVYFAKGLLYPAQVAEAPPRTRLVPMAATDIPAGTLITAEHLITGPKAGKLPRETILNDDKIVGRYAIKDIKQADSILTSDLYGPKERPPLILDPGMKAVTVGIGDSTAIVDGLIVPGDYVDVHLTVNDNRADRRFRGGFTMTMFKGVRLLALNRLTQPGDISRGSNTVTFELTPEQSNILLEAKQHGILTVSLNPDGPGEGGVDVADADRAYFEEILGLPEIPEPPKPFLTELYRGTSRAVIGYGDDRDDYYNDGRATPWVEDPGWAPPRNSGRLNRGRGGSGGRGYGNGYRGTSLNQNQNQNSPEGNTNGQANAVTPAANRT